MRFIVGKSSGNAKKLVIPMIAQNKWVKKDGDDLDAEAVNELIKDVREAEEDGGGGDVAHIPLMMRNRVPVPANGASVDEKYDISIRPEVSGTTKIICCWGREIYTGEVCLSTTLFIQIFSAKRNLRIVSIILMATEGMTELYTIWRLVFEVESA